MNKAYATVDAREHGRRVIVGIELGRVAGHMVELRGGRITAWEHLPYPSGLTPLDPEFSGFLSRALEPFEVRRRDAQLWLLGTFPSLQVRFLTVPHTSPRRLSNVVYWSFRKELPFDPALSVFDYETEGANQSGQIDITAYTALLSDVNAITTLFQKAGHELSGVVIPHFAMRNLFHARWIKSEATCVGLYVGEESSAVQIYANGQLVLSRVFMTGMTALFDAVREQHPDWTDENILQCLQQDPAEDDAVSPLYRFATGRMMQQVERSISAYLLNDPAAEIHQIHVLGSFAGFPHLVAHMGSHLGMDVQAVHGIDRRHVATGVSIPTDPKESAELTMAAATALSPATAAPNLLKPFVVRDRIRFRKRQQLQVAALLVFALSLFGAGYVGARHHQQKQRQTLSALQEQQARYPADLSRERIIQLVAQERSRNLQLKLLARDSRPIAILSEIAQTTPPDIRLTLLRLEQGEGRNRVVMEGLVRGPPASQESRLASYIIQLEDRTLFKVATVHRAIPGREGPDRAVLIFDLELELQPATPPYSVVAMSKETP